MMVLRKRSSSEVGIRVGRIRGMEKHGRVIVLTNESDAVGGQCSICHVIVWASGSRNPLLGRPKPAACPDSGDRYSEYVAENRLAFLRSFSLCPECNSVCSFDLFVSNITSTRYEDGTERIAGDGVDYYDVPEDEAWVWWLDF